MKEILIALTVVAIAAVVGVALIRAERAAERSPKLWRGRLLAAVGATFAVAAACVVYAISQTP